MVESTSSQRPYRLGLDMGSASIGWAILRLDEQGHPDYLIRLGVRLFPSGRNQKDGTSLAAYSTRT